MLDKYQRKFLQLIYGTCEVKAALIHYPLNPETIAVMSECFLPNRWFSSMQIEEPLGKIVLNLKDLRLSNKDVFPEIGIQILLPESSQANTLALKPSMGQCQTIKIPFSHVSVSQIQSDSRKLWKVNGESGYLMLDWLGEKKPEDLKAEIFRKCNNSNCYLLVAKKDLSKGVNAFKEVGSGDYKIRVCYQDGRASEADYGFADAKVR